MSEYKFSIKSKKVAKIRTYYRAIQGEIPDRRSVHIFKILEKYEAHSMHGQLPVVWDKAKDYIISDAYGNRWIDFTSTIFVTNTGHSNKKVVSALKRQLQVPLLHTYTFANQARVDFIRKLISITPNFCQKAFLLSAGTEATECAVKLMRMYGQKIHPKKMNIIAFRGSMHGRTMAAEMLRGDEATACWIGHKDPHMYHLKFPDIPNSRCGNIFKKDMAALRRQGLDFKYLCAVMIESYQGWSAAFYPKEYIKLLCNFAKKYNALIVFDEIQGGFGRTGKMFAYQHYGVTPDLLCLGKGLSGGLPLSAVIGRSKILDLPEIGSMSSTHSANPLCCVAALANLKEILSKCLIRSSYQKGKILYALLYKIKSKYPAYIEKINANGLLTGIIIKNPKTGEPDARIASIICEKAMYKGLLLIHTGRESIKIGPPLTISEGALREGVQVIDECFSELTLKG